MVYTMVFYVNGGCRRNGGPDAIGAAAAVVMRKRGGSMAWRCSLSRYPTPTNQRAELTAIIMALEQALEKYDELNGCPDLDVTIRSDARYAIGCTDQWIYKWAMNGWRNARGLEVANRDLIEQASDLDDRVKELGTVMYLFVPKAENAIADALCNIALDE